MMENDPQVQDLAAQFMLEDGDERNLVRWLWLLPLAVPPARVAPAVGIALTGKPPLIENMSPNRLATNEQRNE
jgi:hypothetical protein